MITFDSLLDEVFFLAKERNGEVIEAFISSLSDIEQKQETNFIINNKIDNERHNFLLELIEDIVNDKIFSCVEEEFKYSDIIFNINIDLFIRVEIYTVLSNCKNIKIKNNKTIPSECVMFNAKKNII